MAGTKVVKMRNTLGYGGKLYGPGDAVEVPEALARAMGLEEVEQPKAATSSKQSTRRKAAQQSSDDSASSDK